MKEEWEINQEFQAWKSGHPAEAEGLSFWRKGIPFDINALEGYYDRLGRSPAANFIEKKKEYSFVEAVRAFDQLVAFKINMSPEVKEELWRQCSVFSLVSEYISFPGKYDMTFMFTDNVNVGADERTEIRELLVKNNLHPLTGKIYGILTDELTGEQYDMIFKDAGWGSCDDAATYGEISMKQVAEASGSRAAFEEALL